MASQLIVPTDALQPQKKLRQRLAGVLNGHPLSIFERRSLLLII
jgi:hypothetical protein